MSDLSSNLVAALIAAVKAERDEFNERDNESYSSDAIMRAKAEVERCKTAVLAAMRLPDEPSAGPSPVEAFQALQDALPDGFRFPTMDTNDASPVTQQEVVSAIHHHARELARLTAAWPPQPPDASHPDAARIDWLTAQQVDTIYLDDGRIIDVGGHRKRPHDLRFIIDERRASPAP